MPPRRRFTEHPLYPRATRLPTEPGVYVMRDGDGRVLYVGKAVNLRARVRSYFHGTDGRPRMGRLMSELKALEVHHARDEREALLLEAELIRRYQPPYNIKLKDGHHPWRIVYDPAHPYPRLSLTRDAPPEQPGSAPLPSGWHARGLHALLERHFPLRQCEDETFRRSRRPCLMHQVHRCLAPCSGRVPASDYAGLLAQALETLSGGREAMAEYLRKALAEAADRLEFERAALLRDQLRALFSLERQAPEPVAGMDRDVIGLARAADELSLVVLPVRFGRQQETRAFYFRDPLQPSESLLEVFLLQLYATQPPPLNVVLPFPIDSQEVISQILTDRFQHPVRLLPPPDEAGLEATADRAARGELTLIMSDQERSLRGAEALGRVITLEQPLRGLLWLDLDRESGRLIRLRWLEGQVTWQRLGPVWAETGEEARLDWLAKGLLSGPEEPPVDVVVLGGGRQWLEQARALAAGLGLGHARLLALPTLGSRRRISDPERLEAVSALLLPGRRNPLKLPPYSPARAFLEGLLAQLHSAA